MSQQPRPWYRRWRWQVVGALGALIVALVIIQAATVPSGSVVGTTGAEGPTTVGTSPTTTSPKHPAAITDTTGSTRAKTTTPPVTAVVLGIDGTPGTPLAQAQGACADFAQVVPGLAAAVSERNLTTAIRIQTAGPDSPYPSMIYNIDGAADSASRWQPLDDLIHQLDDLITDGDPAAAITYGNLQAAADAVNTYCISSQNLHPQGG